MSRTVSFRLLARAILAALLLGVSASAQQPAVSSSDLSSPSQPKPTPPLPTAPKPPVDLFRSLLAMSPVERREFLAKRSPEAQKLILAKIHEYEGLTPELRELRLRVTELRWYLLPLLITPGADRPEKLRAIPPDLRDLIAARLDQWDQLTPELQKQFLENEAVIRFYFELAAGTPDKPGRATPAPSIPAPAPENPGLQRWRALNDDERQEIVRHFSEYFDFSPPEKEKILHSLSEPERLQIEKTLQTFGGLTAAQRLQCFRSFQKFASFNPEERQQFLHNARRWEQMSPTERQTWRNLVSSLSRQPPLPPGLAQPPVPLRPVPKVLDPRRTPKSWATNSN
jgi:hypothetical protein